MKTRWSNDLKNSKVVLLAHLSEQTANAKRDSGINFVCIAIIWFILGTVCAGLAWVLLSILLK
jgi:hypothetical protein